MKQAIKGSSNTQSSPSTSFLVKSACSSAVKATQSSHHWGNQLQSGLVIGQGSNFQLPQVPNQNIHDIIQQQSPYTASSHDLNKGVRTHKEVHSSSRSGFGKTAQQSARRNGSQTAHYTNKQIADASKNLNHVTLAHTLKSAHTPYKQGNQSNSRTEALISSLQNSFQPQNSREAGLRISQQRSQQKYQTRHNIVISPENKYIEKPRHSKIQSIDLKKQQQQSRQNMMTAFQTSQTFNKAMSRQTLVYKVTAVVTPQTAEQSFNGRSFQQRQLNISSTEDLNTFKRSKNSYVNDEGNFASITPSVQIQTDEISESQEGKAFSRALKKKDSCASEIHAIDNALDHINKILHQKSQIVQNDCDKVTDHSGSANSTIPSTNASPNDNKIQNSMRLQHLDLQKINFYEDNNDLGQLDPSFSPNDAQSMESEQQQEEATPAFDLEEELRKVTENQRVEIFDLQFILNLINNKYGLSHKLSDFQVHQRIERRPIRKASHKPSADTGYIKEFQNKLWGQLRVSQSSRFSTIPGTQQVCVDQAYLKTQQNHPQVTAKSWAIYDGKKCMPLWSKALDTQCEIASLTKIMTAYIACKLITELHLNPKSTYMRVSKKASTIGGTSAYLRAGQRVTIYDLLVGLMLPSGNDAAIVLAEHFGRLLLIEKARINHQTLRSVVEQDPFCDEGQTLYVKKFVKHMNVTAKQLKMINTQYSNPHGLSDKANKSAAADITRLAFQALKLPLFKEIVDLKSYTTTSVCEINVQTLQCKLISYTWQNLNILLNNPGFRGVKTGYTSTAGSCLCTHYVDEAKGINLIITLLCSKSKEYRFIEMAKLAYWAIGRLEVERKGSQ